MSERLRKAMPVIPGGGSPFSLDHAALPECPRRLSRAVVLFLGFEQFFVEAGVTLVARGEDLPRLQGLLYGAVDFLDM